ncbi:MAG: hypothetical protein ACE5RS_04225 [Nitrosopumilus sp.]|nr:hypothetical protein [Nitrosopumilus sp.]
MNKKIIIAPIVAIVAIFLVSLSDDSSSQKDDVSFHVTLADPELYINGVYSDTFTIEKGDYIFRFVPNGSSPKVLSIILSGNTVDFSEDFKLVGTPHQTGISEYFTWDYDGEREISISETQEISIVINPNNETMGSVSVDILEN